MANALGLVDGALNAVAAVGEGGDLDPAQLAHHSNVLTATLLFLATVCSWDYELRQGIWGWGSSRWCDYQCQWGLRVSGTLARWWALVAPVSLSVLDSRLMSTPVNAP